MSDRGKPDEAAPARSASPADSASLPAPRPTASSVTETAPFLDIPQFLPRPLSARAQQHHRTPEPGDLHLWRFQSHWVPASVGESQLWLGANERQSIRRLASPAARRRAALGWTTLRWVAAGLAGCAPRDVELRHGSADGLKIVGTPLRTELLFTGFWILLAVHREHDGAEGRAALAASSASPGSYRTHATREHRSGTEVETGIDAAGAAVLRRGPRAPVAPAHAAAEQAGRLDPAARERVQRYALPMPPGAGVLLRVGPCVRRVRGFGWRTGDRLQDIAERGDAAVPSEPTDVVGPR